MTDAPPILTGPVTDDLSSKIVSQLLALDAKDCEKPIRVYINSPGGSVDAGFAIYDVMRFVKLDKEDFVGKSATQVAAQNPLRWTCAYLHIEADGESDGHGEHGGDAEARGTEKDAAQLFAHLISRAA